MIVYTNEQFALLIAEKTVVKNNNLSNEIRKEVIKEAEVYLEWLKKNHREKYND